MNEACHPDMTKESLRDMENRAKRREYTYGEVDLGDVVVGAIRLIRMQNHKNT